MDGEKVLNQLLNNKFKNKKVIIGPLYRRSIKKLSTYIKKYPYIKVLTASKYSTEKILNNNNLNINEENICIVPTGIVSEKKLDNFKNKNRNTDCLVYFKNRDQIDLENVINFLKSRSIAYKLFEYGKYKNIDLIKTAKKSGFCVLINGAESQGIAMQEILMMNLPLYVWNLQDDLNNFASSVPYFDSGCGMIVNNFDEFTNNFDEFINKLNSFKPSNIIHEKLTFEKFISNLQNEFDKLKY